MFYPALQVHQETFDVDAVPGSGTLLTLYSLSIAIGFRRSLHGRLMLLLTVVPNPGCQLKGLLTVMLTLQLLTDLIFRIRLIV